MNKSKIILIAAIVVTCVILLALLFAVTNTSPFKSQGAKEAQTCGGIAGIKCPSDYTCVYEQSDITDQAGICVKS